MLNELILLAYGEEVLISNPVTMPMLTTTNLQDKLIQDCMWSSHLCDRNNILKKPPPPAPLQLAPLIKPLDNEQEGGVYTPAPSPTPPPSAVVGGDSSHDEGMESDCVSPSVVFPSLLTPPASAKLPAGIGTNVGSVPVAMETNKMTASPRKLGILRKKVTDDPDWAEGDDSAEDTYGRHGYERSQRRKRKLSTAAVATGANSRHQPQSELSTSGNCQNYLIAKN